MRYYIKKYLYNNEIYINGLWSLHIGVSITDERNNTKNRNIFNDINIS